MGVGETCVLQVPRYPEKPWVLGMASGTCVPLPGGVSLGDQAVF